MAIRRVAQKLYAQQGEFGTVRKAYKEAFRRQMIANYAPANIIGRMFGFGSMFHTMAKRGFGAPEWNPRSLETGRPDYAPGAKPYVKGGAGVMPSRASDIILSDIADNTERTADALEKIGSVAADAQKKSDLEENTQKEREFEDGLKNLKPLNLGVGGPASALGAKDDRPSPLGDAISGLIKNVAPYALLAAAVTGGAALLTTKLKEWLTNGAWWKANLIDPLAVVIKQGIDGAVSTVQDAANSFWETDVGKFLMRPFQPTGFNAVREGMQNERFHSQAKHRGRRTVGKSRIENGEPVLRMKIAGLPATPAVPQFFHGGLSNLGALNPAQTTSIGGLEGNLLNTIAQAEAPQSGYDGIFGNNDRTQDFMQLTGGRRLTELSVSEVMALQPRFVALNRARGGNANEGGAVGRYQIVTGTLKNLVRQMGLSGNEAFSPELQDQMALHLMRGRGLEAFKSGKISASQFQNNLSKEWAGLPNVSGLSSYQGVGSNKATISSATVQAALTGTPPLNVPAATNAARATQAAATTAASTTQVQAAMNTPESIGTTIMGSIPAAALGTSPQMSESIDEFVTRVLVAMGVVTST
jgi:muramidase (phage lysozyme)